MDVGFLVFCLKFGFIPFFNKTQKEENLDLLFWKPYGWVFPMTNLNYDLSLKT